MRNSQNTGYQIERARFGLLERIFAEEWNSHNKRFGYSYGVLQELFVKSEGRMGFGFGRTYKRIITKMDRFIVATVIQWLGTNVGFCFLETCLRKAGYKIIYDTVSEKQKEYYDHLDSSKWHTRQYIERRKHLWKPDGYKDNGENYLPTAMSKCVRCEQRAKEQWLQYRTEYLVNCFEYQMKQLEK